VNLANSVLSTSWVFRAMSAYANNVQGNGRVLQVARVTKCSGDDTHTHTHSHTQLGDLLLFAVSLTCQGPTQGSLFLLLPGQLRGSPTRQNRQTAGWPFVAKAVPAGKADVTLRGSQARE